MSALDVSIQAQVLNLLLELQARCKVEAPALREIAPGHVSRCHFAGEMTF